MKTEKINSRFLKFMNASTNKKYAMDSYVERRLDEWAKWFRSNDYRHLGYPSESLEFRHLNSGGVTNQSYGPKLSPCNANAEEVEEIIVLMKQIDPKIATVLCQEYLDWRDQSTKAKLIGVSLAQFKIDLALARNWLRGWFCANLSKHKDPFKGGGNIDDRQHLHSVTSE